MRKLSVACCGLLVLAAGLRAEASVFDVRTFGAKGDGVTKDTAALQKAIDAASAAGGGEVLVGPGTYVSGSLFLKSNVDFHVGPGATIFGSPDKADYNAPDVCPQNRVLKEEASFGAHLFLCIEQRNVTLRGPGKIDGNSLAFIAPPGSDKAYEVREIPWRPSQMLFFCESSDIRIRDLELSNAPYWSCFLHGCERAFVTGLYIHNSKKPYTHTGDGLDIDSCEYVSVSDCLIDVTDDGITLRGNYERLKKRRDCAHVTISNCRISSMCNAVRFGVGNGNIHDIDLCNIDVFNSRIAYNFVSAWSSVSRGCDMHNIRVANSTVNCYQRFLRMSHKVAKEAKVHDIYFEGISGTARDPAHIAGNEKNPFRNLHLRNVDVTGGAVIEHVEGLDISGGSLKRLTAEEIEALKKAGGRPYGGVWD